MKKDLTEEIVLPEGVEAEITDRKVSVKSNNVVNERFFNYSISMKKDDGKIILSEKKATKREKNQLMSAKAHILNMIKGLKEKYVYKLQICTIHFPVTTTIDKGEFVVKNFLGEIKPRKLKLKPGVEVKVEKEIITVSSHNKELAGQTAADIECLTKIKSRDRRVFQDGIFIVQRP
jgi:large subunit ribosomal protein L6